VKDDPVRRFVPRRGADPRETAPMSEAERSVAEFMRIDQLGLFSQYWVFALAGATIGMAPPLIGIFAAAVFRPDIDAFALFGRMWGEMVALGAVSAILLVGIAMLGVRLDRRKNYWNRLPSEGRVALERVALRGVVAFWAHDPIFGPAGGRPRSVRDWVSKTVARRAQIVLARTTSGWWVHPQRVPQGWDGRAQLWQTLAGDVAVAYAPRTEIELGIRVAGPEIPVVATCEDLTGDELEILRQATGSKAEELPSGHVRKTDAVRAVDALVLTRLGAAAGAIPGLSA
jgi:hypothetical protein